jgi:lipopolysaccharide export system protein LptA
MAMENAKDSGKARYKRMKKIKITCCCLLLLQTLAAQAERADALKAVTIQSRTQFMDNVAHNAVATGNVVITRGTTVLRGDRAEVTEAPDGYRAFILTAAPGKLATFRQKRDGGLDLWAEGHAERIEYDERTEVIKLLSAAMIRELEGQRVTHQMEQAFISYDDRRDVLLGRNDPNGADIPSNGRGSITVAAHRRAPLAPAPASNQ